ncbi:hypothetical protein Ae168Ps1_5348c [Pseudonocardia sp. Ae168_Ps1]|nr:hypothetical protein Ae150APs1_5304c [Pseudonocardia sp. Ae150A_Ps1]OLL82942.1 hypothetical protein Ae168Ps1_5348c [Pseudonocardia sp. Ae168_Ps1]OLL82949.1 hypothetical protein Ae263Ps1_0004 [Pseudonocardia sp. Ae263_Ps1]OLL91013.1 hypothetical protein Ae356Ps1_0910c [Pseudonocardia sp. Ae356_Ps1]
MSLMADLPVVAADHRTGSRAIRQLGTGTTV